MSYGDLSPLEQFVLLALPRLGEDAYGMRIRQEIEARSGRTVSIAAVYAALNRLEERRMVSSWHSDPTGARGGRARKHFRISPVGARKVTESRIELERMWAGLEQHPELEGGG
jgi:PadR family transcriptional regulator PadR